MAKAEVVKLMTPPFIAAFVQGVWEAQPGPDGGKPKFGFTAIWDREQVKNDPKWKAMLAELDKQVQAKFKVPFDFTKMTDAGLKTGLRKGESKPDLEGFGPGKIFASLTSQYAPGVVGLKKGPDGKYLPISHEDGNAELLYAGCLCRATINVYTYANKGKGVALGLQSIQVLSSDESKYPRIDSRSSAADDYDDAEVDGSWLDQEEGSLDDDIPF